jgi:pimeloyl-ACP methyl ester carboxylesterase
MPARRAPRRSPGQLTATHRQVAVNAIELHVAEQGAGFPVIFCHGFPELWYSWRHQLPAVAAAGYRGIAPDMRGYGGSSIPTEVEAYDIKTISADLVGLLDVLDEERAVFVGHDWGAAIVWELARLHPERVAAVVGMSVPFVPRTPTPPVELLQQALGEDFVIVWFQTPGEADQAFARNVRRTLTSSELRKSDWEKDREATVPPWMTREDLEIYATAFERTGFTGGLNYYRNIDRNWELLAAMSERRIEQPALFVIGSEDWIPSYMPLEAVDDWVPNLRKATIEGAGHWLQQERPEVVNEVLISFLREAAPEEPPRSPTPR